MEFMQALDLAISVIKEQRDELDEIYLYEVNSQTQVYLKDCEGSQTSQVKQADFSNIKDKGQLQNIAQKLTFEKYAPIPQKVSLDEFLQESHTFDNVENFIKHLQTRQDAKAREAYLNLIEPTKQNPDLIINTGDKQEFIKAFEYERNGKKEIFNIVATQENGKIVLSALPTKKIDYIKNKIKNADSIEVKQGAIKDFTTPLENQSLTHEGIIPNNPKSILESAKNQISETEALKQDFQHLQKEAQNLKTRDIKAREANEKKMFDSLDAREARIKKQAEQELGRSLDEDKIYYELYKTGKIKYKQSNEMQKEMREAYWDWWEKQIEKGNKELLEYN